MRKPTIYEALREKLGREPTHAETVNDVKRILGRNDYEPCPDHRQESDPRFETTSWDVG